MTFYLEEAGVLGKHNQGLEHTHSPVHFHALLPYHMSYHKEHMMTYGISRQSSNTHSSKVSSGCGHLPGDIRCPHGSADAWGHAKVACGSTKENDSPSSLVAGPSQEPQKTS